MDKSNRTVRLFYINFLFKLNGEGFKDLGFGVQGYKASIFNKFSVCHKHICIGLFLKNMPIRRSWHAESLDEGEFKADLIKRLTITLNTLDPNKVVSYEITRNQSGGIISKAELSMSGFFTRR